MIEIRGLCKTYSTGSAAVAALRDVSLAIGRGEFVAIMGPSGSGKSTLLHMLGCLDRPDTGSYKILGNEIARLSDDELASLRNCLLGFVFQQFHLLRRTSALENVQLPLVYAGKRKLKELAVSNLEAVGLAHRLRHKPNELSGGEQQRVAIARSLVNDPLIILADEPTGNLDTKSEEEIMEIIQRLNDEGKTIVMVTHEKEIARYAKRIITMRDGRIVSDEKKEAVPGARDDDVSVKDAVSQCHSAFARVEFMEHVRQSVRAIFSNKVRSFLSILGILFGVGAVIAMLALGTGAKSSIEDRLKSMGSNLLSIRGGSSRMHGFERMEGSVARFTLYDVQAMRELKPLIKSVAGAVSGTGQTVYGNKNWSTSVNGVDYDYGEMRAAIPEIGRWFSRQEYAARAKSAILGTSVAKELFGGKNPVGETIKINRIEFRVVGVAPEKGFAGPRDQDDVIYVPITTAMNRLLGKDYLDQIYVEVSDAQKMEEVKEKISNLIKKRHRIYADDDSFHIRDMSEIQQMLSTTTKTMSMLLGCIAAISLIVGGIGIMNIMLVSVTERTREIGLRKAIGARRGDIMTQFLIESVAMTFIGGLMGIALGAGSAIILSAFAGWATRVTVFSIVLATTFSIAVGIGFGVWPARKAADLDPIEALRYE